MAHEGTLIFTDRHGEEHRVRVSGDLRLYEDTDGARSVLGVLHVTPDQVAAVRDAMEEQAKDDGGSPGARYTGEVVDAEGDELRPVTDVPMYLMDVYDTGNVRLRSAAPREDR